MGVLKPINADAVSALLVIARNDLQNMMKVSTSSNTWSNITRIAQATTKYYDNPFLGMLEAGMREWVGERVFENIKAGNYRIGVKTFEKSVELDRDWVEDMSSSVLGNELSQINASLLNSYNVKLERDAAELLNNGHAAGYECYDGEPFFDTAHPIDDITTDTYSNYFTSRALTHDNLSHVQTEMMKIRMADGTYPNNPSKWTLIIDPTNKSVAYKLNNSDISTLGVPNEHKGTLDIIVNPYLGASGNWYLVNAELVVAKPLILAERKAPVVVARTDEQSNAVFERNAYQYGIHVRYGWGYGVPFCMAKCTP